MMASMWSKGNTHSLLVGKQTCARCVETSLADAQDDGMDLSQYPAVALSGVRPNDASSCHRDLALPRSSLLYS